MYSNLPTFFPACSDPRDPIASSDLGVFARSRHSKVLAVQQGKLKLTFCLSYLTLDP